MSSEHQSSAEWTVGPKTSAVLEAVRFMAKWEDGCAEGSTTCRFCVLHRAVVDLLPSEPQKAADKDPCTCRESGDDIACPWHGSSPDDECHRCTHKRSWHWGEREKCMLDCNCPCWEPPTFNRSEPEKPAEQVCVCGHSKRAHIYEEGACRPGYKCRKGCERYEPLPVGFHRHTKGYCDPSGTFYADEDGGMASGWCPCPPSADEKADEPCAECGGSRLVVNYNSGENVPCPYCSEPEAADARSAVAEAHREVVGAQRHARFMAYVERIGHLAQQIDAEVDLLAAWGESAPTADGPVVPAVALLREVADLPQRNPREAREEFDRWRLRVERFLSEHDAGAEG